MKLDYIANINAYGDDLVRLYEFRQAEAEKFRLAIHQTILINQNELNLNSLEFLHSRNCNLTLRIAAEELGITTEDKLNFFCDLTIAGYEKMLVLIAPFCKKDIKNYQWLYDDIDTPTGFLFSPVGTW